MLSDADVARDIARQAVAQAEKILRDAQEALKTLQGSQLTKMWSINYNEVNKKIFRVARNFLNVRKSFDCIQ